MKQCKIIVKDEVNVKIEGLELAERKALMKMFEYEVPGVTSIEGVMWKGKADIINHDEVLIVDLKTTSDLSGFAYSAKKYNYDSQAYIYKKLFDYDMIFMAIDKTTHQIGIFDCSDNFLANGEDKVRKAVEAYDLFFKTEDFDPKQFLITKTLN